MVFLRLETLAPLKSTSRGLPEPPNQCSYAPATPAPRAGLRPVTLKSVSSPDTGGGEALGGTPMDEACATLFGEVSGAAARRSAIGRTNGCAELSPCGLLM